MGLEKDGALARRLYADMVRIRRFEEEVFEFYKRGLMPGLAHLYIGEEAVAAGACAAIRPDDFLSSTHRGHGHLVARGADTKKMMAEILGRRDGYCRGKGGSMHIMDMSLGILGANGIVGGGIPIATGAGYSCKYRGTDQVVLCFFGDGASNEGTFHESINMAAAWDLTSSRTTTTASRSTSTASRRSTISPAAPSATGSKAIPSTATTRSLCTRR